MGSAPPLARRRLAVGALSCLLSSGASASLAAQNDPVAKDCDVRLVERLAPEELTGGWAARHPDSVFARLADPMRRNAWMEVFDSLGARFDEMARLSPPNAAYAKIRAELDSLAPLFSQVQALPSMRARGDAPAGRWQLDGDPDMPRYDLFRGTGNRVTVDGSTPRDARRTVCWTALAVRRVLTFLNEPGRLAVVDALERLGTLWNNYAEHGHSQLPWELWINGALGLKRGVLEPPRYQLVILHAAPALEVTGNYPDLDRVDAILVELAGLVAYNGNRTNFLAATAFASATSGLPVGWGPMLHLGRAFKLGYAFRERDDDGRQRGGLLMSADLFGFVLDAPQLVRVRTVEALQKKLLCLTGRC